jgi:hypothetical protein
MGLFTNFFRGRDVRNLFITNLSGELGREMAFTPVDVSTPDGQYKAYMRTPVVNTVIDRIAETATNSYAIVQDSKQEPSTSLAAKELLKMMEAPNGLQNYSDFIKQVIINYFVFDEVFIMPIRLDGLNGIKGYSILPNQYLLIEMDYRNYPFQVTKSNCILRIQYTNPHGNVIDLTPRKDELIVLKGHSRPESPARGQSVFPSLRDHVNKYLISSNAAADILQNYGAIGMWVNEGADQTGTPFIAPNEKTLVEDALNLFGIQSGRKKHIVTSQRLRHEKISSPLVDMGLNEITADSVRTICDRFGYPYDLLANEKGGGIGQGGGKEEEAKRQLITETIEPVMYKLSEAFSRSALTPSENLIFTFDHLPCMQESEVQKSDLQTKQINMYNTLLDKGMITIQEYKQILTDMQVL